VYLKQKERSYSSTYINQKNSKKCFLNELSQNLLFFLKYMNGLQDVPIWLPGSYNPQEESKKMFYPLNSIPGFHCCGESYSFETSMGRRGFRKCR
jgi:hypothetical protein